MIIKTELNITMKLPICNFEIATMLKEIGFDLECLNFYTKPRSKMFGIDGYGRAYPIHNAAKKLYTCGKDAALNSESAYSAPTLALAQMYLREKHDLSITVSHFPKYTNEGKVEYIEYRFSTIEDGEVWDEVKRHKSYDQALESGILEAIKLIKTKQDD